MFIGKQGCISAYTCTMQNMVYVVLCVYYFSLIVDEDERPSNSLGQVWIRTARNGVIELFVLRSSCR